MKRYERMSKEEIIEAFQGIDGSCDECCARDCCVQGGGCVESITNWLNKEIETKPRAATINTEEEVRKAWRFYEKHVLCKEHVSIEDWLCEEIEVE